MLKVNGKNYDWGDVDVKFPGLVLVVQEISYDDEQDMEESYGRGYKPRGFGKGNYKASGKLSMLRDDYEDLLAFCKARGVSFYDLELPSMRRTCSACAALSSSRASQACGSLILS